MERFNENLEYEWLNNFNLSLNPEEVNPRLAEWLIEYNFNCTGLIAGITGTMSWAVW
jgi:hypothetical protein